MAYMDSRMRDKMVYNDRFIDNYTNKVLEVNIITLNPIDKGPIKMYVKGRAALYCYPSYEEFIKDWSIPPIDSSCPEDDEWIKELYS